jgi:serine/threonine protein kinase
MVDYTGRYFGKYELLEQIGKGSFAVVYRGRQVETGEEVAVKIFHGIFSEQESLEKLRREADICKSLNHPNIVRVREFGVEYGVPYLVMDYAPMPFLREYPHGTVLPLTLVLKYLKQLGAALQYAHDKQVVHRDIKPANLLLSATEDVLLADFGIARVLGAGSEHHTLTITGTPQYMAPEQFQLTAGPKSDQYSLGVVVYEWLVGRRPFEGDVAALMKAHREAPPEPLRSRGAAVPEVVERAVLRALAKKPEERFPNVWAFVGDVEAACRAAGVAPAPISRSAQVSPAPVIPLPPVGGVIPPEQPAMPREAGQGEQFSGVQPGPAQPPAAPASQPLGNPPPPPQVHLPPVSPSESAHGLPMQGAPPPAQVHLPPVLPTGPLGEGGKPLPQPGGEPASGPQESAPASGPQAPAPPSALGANPPPPVRANLPPPSLSSFPLSVGGGQTGEPPQNVPPPLPGLTSPASMVLPGSPPVWPPTVGPSAPNPPSAGSGMSVTPPAAPSATPAPVAGMPPGYIPGPPASMPGAVAGTPPVSPGPLNVPMPSPLFGGQVQPPGMAAMGGGLPGGAPLGAPLGAQVPTTPAAVPPAFGGGATPGMTFNNQVTLPMAGQRPGAPVAGPTVLPPPPEVAGLDFERAVGTDVGVYREHQGQVKELHWVARSSGEVFSLDDQGMLHYWLASGQRMAPPHPLGKGFWASKKEYVACPAADGIHVWNVLSRPPKEDAYYTGQRGEDLLVAWVANDTLLVSGGQDPALHIWSKDAPGVLVSMYQGHGSRVTKLAVSRDTNWVASAEESGRINVWQPRTGEGLANYAGHQAGHRPIVLMEWSPDGSRIASLAEFDREVHVWEARSGQLLTRHRTVTVDTLMAWSPDGGSLASKHERDSRVVEVWDAGSGDARVSYRCPGTVAALAWSPDGKRIAAACGKEVHVFDPRSGRQLFVYRGHDAPVTVLAWSPSPHAHLIVSADSGDLGLFQGIGQVFGQRGAQVRVWQAPEGRPGVLAPLDRFVLWLGYMKKQLGGNLAVRALVLFFVDFLVVPWVLSMVFPLAWPLDVVADLLAMVALFGGLYSKELRRPLFWLLQALLLGMWGCMGLKLGALVHVMWLAMVVDVVGFLLGVGISYALHRKLLKRLNKV